MKRRGIALSAAALLVAVPAAVLAWYAASVDPNTVRTRVIAEVQRATGRQLAIGGALHISLFPTLTVDADDVALANPAGFSRPAMLTAQHLHATVALFPLLNHQIVITRLALTLPDLKLEQPPGAVANWSFDHARPSAALPHATHPADTSHARLDSLTILDLDITDGRLGWQLPGQIGHIALTTATLREVNDSSTIHVDIAAVFAGDPITLAGELGAQTHLWNAADRSEWPVELTLQAQAGTATVSGALTRPRALAGYDIALRAHGQDLGKLAQTWPALKLPRLQDVVLDTRLIDRPDGLDMPRLSLTAGASDLSPLVDGLSLTHLEIAAPNIDGTNGTQPNHISIGGQYAGQELQLDATLGPIGRLFGRGQAMARSPITTNATATAAGATLLVKGRIAPYGDWRGTDATLSARVPDLSPFSALAGRKLPALHDLALDLSMRSSNGVLSLQAAHLTLPEADITATGSATLGCRPNYDLALDIARLNLDALRAAQPPAPAAAAPSASSSQTAPAPAGWIIPDRPLPFDRLLPADADVRLRIAQLIIHGQRVENLAAQLRLDHGRLDIDPARAILAGAPVTGSLSIDARRTPPALALDLQAPGLDLGSLLALAGVAGQAHGKLDLDALLAGGGASPHAIAGTLDGHFGLALTGGAIGNAALTETLGYLVPLSRIGLTLPGTGSSNIACLATRLDVHGGVGVPRAFLLDTGRFRVAAAGAVDLGHETFSLRLRPYLRLGFTGLVLPSHADGSWRDPRLTLEAAGGAQSAASLAAGLITGRDATLSAMIAGLASTTDLSLALADSGDCGPALAAAHDTSGTLPNPQTPGPPPPETRRERAMDLLHRLFK